jgi:hypothetical protein
VEEGACGHIVIPPLLLLDRYTQACIALLRVSYSQNNIITDRLRRKIYSKSKETLQLDLAGRTMAKIKAERGWTRRDLEHGLKSLALGLDSSGLEHSSWRHCVLAECEADLSSSAHALHTCSELV